MKVISIYLKVLFLFIGLFFNSGIVTAQLNIIKVGEQAEKKDSIIPYDSLTNITKSNFKSQIGQTWYYYGTKKDREKGIGDDFYTKIRKKKDTDYFEEVYNSVYKEVMKRGYKGTDLDSVANRYYYVNRILESEKSLFDDEVQIYIFELIMKDAPYEKLYYRYRKGNPLSFINVGYFEKLKERYIGKALYAFQTYSTFSKLKTDEEVVVPKGTKFICKDIAIREDWLPFIVLLEHPVYKELYEVVNEKEIDDIYGLETEQQYQTRLKKEAVLGRKYGRTNADLIIKNQIRIGWTKAMCIEAWGEPESVNVTKGSYGNHEQWVYHQGSSYLYFENGILRTIQDY